MKTNNQQEEHVTMDRTEVHKSTFLGSTSSTTGRTEEDIKPRLGKARHTFSALILVWRSTIFSTRDKLKIFNSNGQDDTAVWVHNKACQLHATQLSAKF